jgi:glycogen debranching enzyme
MTYMAQTSLSELVTLVGGGTVVVATRDGLIGPRGTGVFHADRRLISRLHLRVADHTLTLIGVSRSGAHHWVSHHLVVDATGQHRALLSRTWDVSGTMAERMAVRAFGAAVRFDLTLDVVSDMAVLMHLRASDVQSTPLPFVRDGDDLVATEDGFGVHVIAPGAAVDVVGPGTAGGPGGRVSWSVNAAPGAPGAVSYVVSPWPEPAKARPRRSRLQIAGDHRWRRVVDTAIGDLAALHMELPERGVAYIGAGAPWYMALFGRDALLTAYEGLMAGTDPAMQTLEALAAFQGTATDATTGEEPGKILHELRTGHSGIFGLQPWQPYFGSVDATPLFVVLLGEAYRWGASPDRVAALLPAARAAVAWCQANSSRNARGHVTYTADAYALRNQGWKDSADAMVHADGTLAEGPIALVEVQAYHWRALRELAALEQALGDAGAASGLLERADRVARALVEDYWLADRQVLAMATDRTGAPLAVMSSDAGHCLWMGALAQDVGGAVADMLSAPAMNAGWGIRTLGNRERAYDPLSYHRGSVWPHDSALVIDGLARYGRNAAAGALIDGLLTAAEHSGWRLPELYGGYGHDEVPAPVPYPVACSPQAWSAAAPLHLLRTVLQLHPDVPRGAITVGPPLTGVSLHVTGIALGDHRVEITAAAGHVETRIDPPLRIH